MTTLAQQVDRAITLTNMVANSLNFTTSDYATLRGNIFTILLPMVQMEDFENAQQQRQGEIDDDHSN